jgi:hypothetical protein
MLLNLKKSGVIRFGDVRGYVTGLSNPVHHPGNLTLSAALIMLLLGDALSLLNNFLFTLFPLQKSELLYYVKINVSVILVPVNIVQLYYEGGNTGPQISAEKHILCNWHKLLELIFILGLFSLYNN